jgi:HEAT repeat protein
VRFNAAWSIGELAIKSALRPLIYLLRSDASANVRRGAAEALGKLGDIQAVEPLISCLTDSSDIVLEAIDHALQRLGYAVE